MLPLFLGAIAAQVASDTQAATSPPASGDTQVAELVAEIPLAPNRASHDRAPKGIAIGADGTLYVIDASHDRIQILDRAANPIATWGERGSGPGQFRFQEGPCLYGDLAVGPEGNLYVTDPLDARVQVLAPDGTLLAVWGEAGAGKGQFAAPQGIAVDGAGRVYVTDTGKRWLQVFTPDGRFLVAWAPPADLVGSFWDLADVVVDAAGVVAVTDYANDRVYRFDPVQTALLAPDRPIVERFGESGTHLGQLTDPRGVALDAQGNLCIAEAGGHRIQVFASDGTPRGVAGSVGLGPGQLIASTDLAVSPDGVLYVADEGTSRVQVFRLLSLGAPVVGTPAVN
jgi:tripartite motif-containing protein 71